MKNEKFYEEQAYRLDDISTQIEVVMVALDLLSCGDNLNKNKISIANGDLGKLCDGLRIAKENLDSVSNAICPEEQEGE